MTSSGIKFQKSITIQAQNKIFSAVSENVYFSWSGSIVRELIIFDLRQLYLKKRKIGLAQGITWRLAVKGLIKHPKLLENPLSTNIPCT